MPSVDPALSDLLAFAIAIIFAGSAAAKFADLDGFEGALADYRLMPRALDRPAVYTIPICELVLAAAILFPPSRALAAGGLVILLGAFSIAITINLARGRRNIDCGCFGPVLRQELSGWLLIRNLVLVAAALSAALATTERAFVALDYVTIAFGAVTLVFLYLSANYAIANAPHTRALAGLRDG